MNRTLIAGGFAAALALSLAMAPGTASACCADSKMEGTVLGGVGGALIGWPGDRGSASQAKLRP